MKKHKLDRLQDTELLDFLEKNPPDEKSIFTGWIVQMGSYESNFGLVQTFENNDSIRQALKRWRDIHERSG